MKLFLSSISIAEQNQEAFVVLVDKPKQDIRVALIENGADPYPEDHREWVVNAREMIRATVGEIISFDLREYVGKGNLEEDLTGFDVIWVGGGNVFYLRWISRESGFDTVIKKLVAKGMLYGGDSAGAIIAGPTIDHFQPADTPEKAPEIILDGFGLTDVVVVPHFDNEKFKPTMSGIKEAFEEKTNYKLTFLNDNQALVIKDDTQKVIG